MKELIREFKRLNTEILSGPEVVGFLVCAFAPVYLVAVFYLVPILARIGFYG